MSLQLFQFFSLIGYVIVFYIIYRFDKAIVRIPLIALVLISFFANPFRMTVEPIKSVEISIGRFDNIPERVLEKSSSFEEFNRQEIGKLDDLYEETKDEVHD